MTAIVTGLLFLAAVGAAPFVGVVPSSATAPALILVGSLMLGQAITLRMSAAIACVTLAALGITLLDREDAG